MFILNLVNYMLTSLIIDTLPLAIRTLRRLSAQALDNELSLQQLRILVLIHEGLTITQIAVATQVSTAAISKMVDSLVVKKFLIREEAIDRRSLKLTLTTKGQRTRKLVRAAVQRELEKSLKKLSTNEKEDLSRGLKALGKLMEHMHEK
jgi:DNA-binding MarR family transcriptional regulator